MKLIKSFIFVAMFATCALAAHADDDIKNQDFNPITTGVNSLSISPDARGASMGDLGAATDPDVNSQYWNASKYAFAESTAGVSLSYTPWMRKIVNDIFLANLAGYWKLGSGDNQAVSASLRYFSLGEIQGSEESGTSIGSINPFEMSVDLGYSRKLSEKFSMGVVLRYIYSDLGYSEYSATEGNKGASAFAADISGYFTTYPIIGRNECQWSWGFNLSNVGSKVSYDHGDNPAFLPTNLRIGTAFTFPLADYHNLTFTLDANNLLVPAKPRLSEFTDNEEYETRHGKTNRRFRVFSTLSIRTLSSVSPIHWVLNMLIISNSSSVAVTSTRASLPVVVSTSVSVPVLHSMCCASMHRI